MRWKLGGGGGGVALLVCQVLRREGAAGLAGLPETKGRWICTGLAYSERLNKGQRESGGGLLSSSTSTAAGNKDPSPHLPSILGCWKSLAGVLTKPHSCTCSKHVHGWHTCWCAGEAMHVHLPIHTHTHAQLNQLKKHQKNAFWFFPRASHAASR